MIYGIIDLWYGDSCKGKLTDYISATHDINTVVRFSGTANSTHTVVTPEGKRHLFSQIGSNSFNYKPRTVLAKDFVVNPVALQREILKLKDHNIAPEILIDERCQIILDSDVYQSKKMKNGSSSTGAGLHEAMKRGFGRSKKTTIKDIYDHSLVYDVNYEYKETLRFLKNYGIKLFDYTKNPYDNDLIFEGSQGLMLDQDHEFYPHVTHASTGSKNIFSILDECDTPTNKHNCEFIYLSRSYVTRHGKGPFPEERPKEEIYSNLDDDTNVPNEYQGTMRYGILDIDRIKRSIIRDLKSRINDVSISLSFSHLDQCDEGIIKVNDVDKILKLNKDEFIRYVIATFSFGININLKNIYLSNGKTRNDVKVVKVN